MAEHKKVRGLMALRKRYLDHVIETGEKISFSDWVKRMREKGKERKKKDRR